MRVDDVNIAAGLTGDVELLAVGGGGHAFRLLTDRNDMFEFSRTNIDHARGFGVLVGDVNLAPILAERKFLRVRPGGNFSFKSLGRDVDHGNAVCRLVGARVVIVVILLVLFQNRVAVRIQFRRPGDRSAAHRDIDGLAVGTDMNTPGTLADLNRADDVVGRTVYDGEIAGLLIGDVNLVGRGGTYGVRRQGERRYNQSVANHNQCKPVARSHSCIPPLTSVDHST